MYDVLIDWSVSLTAFLLIYPTGWFLTRLRAKPPKGSPVVKVLTVALMVEYAVYVVGFNVLFPLLVIHDAGMLGIPPLFAVALAYAVAVIAPISGLASIPCFMLKRPMLGKLGYTLFMTAFIFALIEFILIAMPLTGLPTLGQLLQMLGV